MTSALGITLAACGSGSSINPFAAATPAEMLRNGNLDVCGLGEVHQATVVALLDVPPEKIPQSFLKKVQFTDVSAKGTNEKLAEVTCGANLKFAESSGLPFYYSPRPAIL